MALVRALQSHGIRVLGSSIIGLEEHTPENIDEVIDYAVCHDTEFHQFMLYTPIPGTPLYAEHEAKGTLGSRGGQLADIHGQLKFNFRHPHINDGQEGEFLLRAFRRDFAVNGPSVVRIVRTAARVGSATRTTPNLRGSAPASRTRRRTCPVKYAGIVWAARQHLRDRPGMWKLMTDLLEEFHIEFGLRSRLGAAIAGRYLLHTVRREEKRLAKGWTYEPPTFYERGRP